ncbi:hypothetical protein SGRA_1971 [Saprospira grandis str. Lewin]|uniref:Uncharacterized protein n=1 Tax=Saprospira grandis (strain Lewin) TaxID=984262 RepID=H6L264_SAPGL|nr:hypothetical protein SGRA_1971 [Saprospira grandis str. Lewin]
MDRILPKEPRNRRAPFFVQLPHLEFWAKPKMA